MSSGMAGLGFSDKKQLSMSTCSYFMEVVKYKSLYFKKPYILRGEIQTPYISQGQGEYFTGLWLAVGETERTGILEQKDWELANNPSTE